MHGETGPRNLRPPPSSKTWSGLHQTSSALGPGHSREETGGRMGQRKASGSQAPFIHWCACPKTSLGSSRPPFISEVPVRRSTPQDQHPQPATLGRTPPPPSLGSAPVEFRAPTVAVGRARVFLETSPEPLDRPFYFSQASAWRALRHACSECLQAEQSLAFAYR